MSSHCQNHGANSARKLRASWTCCRHVSAGVMWRPRMMAPSKRFEDEIVVYRLRAGDYDLPTPEYDTTFLTCPLLQYVFDFNKTTPHAKVQTSFDVLYTRLKRLESMFYTSKSWTIFESLKCYPFMVWLLFRPQFTNVTYIATICATLWGKTQPKWSHDRSK